jgi:hypothetical protein
MTSQLTRLLRRGARGVVALTLVAGVLAPSAALAHEDSPADSRTFAETGYAVADDAIWSFFNQYGGTLVFGPPISREFLLAGKPVQLFENAALQVEPDGSVQPMQLTDLLPYTSFDGLTVPAADPAIAFVAPRPDQTNYSARLRAFVQAVVPEPFLSTFSSTGATALWGVPTSAPQVDPNNPNFEYQRFQNGILLHDLSAGTTEPLPLGEYLKDVLTGHNLPDDLASEAANSPLRPGALGQSDLTDAFVPDALA